MHRCVLSGVLAISLSVGVAAQPKEDDPREQAAAAFLDAEALFKVRDYEAAFAQYKKAYLLSREPSLLFNMAQCARLQGQKELALGLYRSFQRDDAKNPLVKTAAELAEKLEAEIAAARAARPASLPATVPTLPPASVAASPASAPASPALETAPPRESRRPLSLASKALFAGAGAGAVLGLVFGARGLGLARDSVSLQGEDRFAEALDAQDRAHRAALLSDLSLGAAVLLGGAGAVSWWKANPAEVSLSPRGVSLRFSLARGQ